MTKREREQDLRTLIPVVIKLFRALRSWTQTDLADASGVSQARVSLYEAGLKLPSARTVERLCGAVGIPSGLLPEIFAFLRSLIHATRAGKESPVAALGAVPAEIAGAVADAVNSVATRVLVEGALAAEERRRSNPSAEQARAQAAVLWQRFKNRSPRSCRLLIAGGRDYKTWAFCERLCTESVEAAAAGAPVSRQTCSRYSLGS